MYFLIILIEVIKMESYQQYYGLQKDKLKDIFCLRLVNMIAIIIELVAGCYIILSGTQSPFYEMTIVYHSASLFCSIVYHLIPFIRTNILFVLIAQIICSIAFMLLIANVYLYITKSGWDSLGYLVMVVYFTGPSGLVALTLTLMINLEASGKEEKSANQIVYIPAEQYQFVSQPTHKLM